MKASVAYKTLDNITVVLLAFKNFKTALQNEFVQNSESNKELSLSKDSG
jgi:predicted lactoylglutathione lyase